MQRLKQRADFLAATAGAKAPAGGFVLQARDRHEDGPVRVGFTCSKKVGNAVERNRVRRRLREVVRLLPPDRMRRGYDYVLIGRNAALDLPFSRLVEDFDRALHRVHTSRPNSAGRGKAPSTRAGGSPKVTPHRGTK
jgi:ribonuclease P protein component